MQRLRPGDRPRIVRGFHAIVCRALGTRRITHGVPARGPGVLYVANHLSWADIPVLGSLVDASFVAKKEVAGWPAIGWLARLQRTLYVERSRTGVHRERDDMAVRLKEGGSLVLFAESTTSNGTHLRPFRSSLLASLQGGLADTPVQPVTIAYTRTGGAPVTRGRLPAVAWFGDVPLGSHVTNFVGLRQVTAEVLFHPPVSLAALGGRKALASHCHAVIEAGYRALTRGRAML
jgi:1-acyl-sn-glycerol-3-phosphate acyltransferase